MKPFSAYFVSMIAVFLLCLAHQNCAWGQAQKLKHLTEGEYDLWGHLNPSELSPRGDWMSYRMSHKEGIDTLFVKGILNDKTFVFPNSYYGAFSQTNWFATNTPEGMFILNLTTGNIRTVKNVNFFNFTSSGNEMILEIVEEGFKPRLKIISAEGFSKLEIPNVTEFKYNSQEDLIAYATHNESGNLFGVVDLKHDYKIDTICSGSSYSNITWSKSGKTLACVKKFGKPSQSYQNGLIMYNVLTRKINEFSPVKTNSFSNENNILSGMGQNILISEDQERVFFRFVEKKEHPDSSKEQVEIWNTFDKYVFPEEQYRKGRNAKRVGVWIPSLDAFLPITSDRFPGLMLTGNQDHAVVFNPKAYEPQFDRTGPMDFHLINLGNGHSISFLKAHTSLPYHTVPSPDGKYITYFKNKNWWVYNINNRSHTNLTTDIKVNFENTYMDMAGEKNAYGICGWTKKDKSVLLYDKYDIWEIEPLTGKHSRLTRGREEDITFRVEATNGAVYNPNFDGQSVKVVDLDNGLILSANTENGDSGIYKWDRSLGKSKVIMASSRIDFFKEVPSGIIYQEQRFDLSPRLNFISRTGDKKVIFQSNPQQKYYGWGTAKSITYKNSLNQDLRGFICYPPNYNSKKKYPMIVHIYERQFKNFHNYVTPNNHSSTGFNGTNYTLQDYLVLYPDIRYRIGDPANSAVDCVTSAVKHVIGSGIVDKDKIGLIGHSFGGFETNFIMTQTNLFATAVSGAAVNDLQSFYLTINWSTGRPDMWRFENQQWRMDVPLFGSRDKYYGNSPINYVEQINKPILSWAGKNDLQIHWHQNIEWYLALRRLKKEHVLLLYPNEPHFLLTRSNQKDLTQRIQDWFSHYLKGTAAPSWTESP